MAPTTRARQETRSPPRRKTLTCYVLLDKTRRNYFPEDSNSAEIEDGKPKKKPAPVIRAKAPRKVKAKATAKRRASTRTRVAKSAEVEEVEEPDGEPAPHVDEEEERPDVAEPEAPPPTSGFPADVATPVRPRKKRVPPPSPLHPPSDSGKPLTMPPTFDAATPTPDPPPTQPPHLTHRRPQMSSLPPSSPPSRSSHGSLTKETAAPYVPDAREDDPWDPDLHAYEDSENDPANQTFTSIADALGIHADSDQSFHTPVRPRIRHSGGMDTFKTPTRAGFDKSFKTPTRAGDQYSNGNSVAELFADGVDDDNEGSIVWANQGSDKENQASSFHTDENKENPPVEPQAFPSPHAHRGILQPQTVSSSPAQHPDDDPFGFLAAERRVKQRRQLHQQHPDFQSSQPEAGPSRPRPRQPLARRTFAELDPATPPHPPPPKQTVAPKERFAYLPSSSPAHSHSSIEDMYATPPSQRGFGLVMSTPMRPQRQEEQEQEAHTPTSAAVHTPLVAVTPTATIGVMTPRNGDRGRDVTMRRHKPREMVISLSDMEDTGPKEDSPSPVKRKRVDPKEPEHDAEAEGNEQEEEEEEEGEERPAKRIRKGKGKENATRTKRPSREKDEDPMAVTKRLERLLPRRPKRAAARKVRAKAIEEATEDEDEEDAGPSSKPARAERGRRRSVYGRRARGRGARSASGSRGRRKMDESTPEEVREV
ncbi:hypothetical protein OF83DRAFT_145177 [Amylostereum chailletii]|nr:hypothetical protein OF83DRAFT_145177 [Amylostereum chailletii]